jgi:hypothetical protein
MKSAGKFPVWHIPETGSESSVLFLMGTKSSVLFLMGTKSSVLLVLCTLAVELRVGGRILLVTVGYPQALRRDSTVPYHAHRTIPRMSSTSKCMPA